MVDYQYYVSPEHSITGGSGTISLPIPLNLDIVAIGFKFKGVSISGSYPVTGTWYSDYVEVANGQSSSGGVPSGATAAGCAYTGISTYSSGNPTLQNTGWLDSGISDRGVSASASVQLPSLPEGGTFSSGTINYYGYNYDGQTRSIYINGQGPFSVSGGNNKVIQAAMTANDVGNILTCNVSGSGYYQAARVMAIMYYMAPSSPVETKTGNCSNNYGGSVGGPLNNGQTVWDQSMSLPTGNITHSIGGSLQAGFQYAVQYEYQQSYEIKTQNVGASCNGYSCGYSDAINNGNWVLSGTGVDSWIRMDDAAFVPGLTASIGISVGGSQKCSVQIAYAYTRARPTPVQTIQALKSPTTTINLPVVARDDLYLDLNPYCQICTDIDPVDVFRAVDLVEVDDGDASAVRIRTSAGTKAVRKKFT